MQILENQAFRHWSGVKRIRLSVLPASDRLRLGVRLLTPAQRFEVMDELSIIAHYTTNQIIRDQIHGLLQTDVDGRAMLTDFGDTKIELTADV